MPRLPKESLPKCETCRKIKKYVRTQLKECRKHIIIYAVFYILLMEISSLFLVEKSNYLFFWYPLLNSIGYLFVFASLFLSRNRLKFCYLKSIAVFCLGLYYLFSILCLVFQINETLYTNCVNNMLLSISVITVILSLYRLENNG